MKVKELIEALAAAPGDYEVLTEGCDCIGDVASVEVNADDTDHDWKADGSFARPSVMVRRGE